MGDLDLSKLGLTVKTESDVKIPNQTIIMIVVGCALIFASYFLIKNIAQ